MTTTTTTTTTKTTKTATSSSSSLTETSSFYKTNEKLKELSRNLHFENKTLKNKLEKSELLKLNFNKEIEQIKLKINLDFDKRKLQETEQEEFFIN